MMQLLIYSQGLIQKDKVHIDCEKGAQIFSLLRSHYVADLIKKTRIAFNSSFSSSKDYTWTRSN